ncbi:MAG: tetratricopeptide repeat protein [Candidatus Cloacimonetes bacterium]|nr:tetratricopeptide repeat protein [Candidatus Cloacimonadota bacterium]
MFCALSTVPNKQNKLKRDAFDYIVPSFIFGVWGILIAFGILTLIQPKWLVEASNPGRTEEALSIKEQADDILRKRQFKASIKLYEQVLRIDPEIKDAIGNIALAYRELGEYDKALDLFNGLVSKYPEQAHLNYINIAELYLKTGDFRKAGEYYAKSAEVAPEPDYGCFRGAQIYINHEMYSEAIPLLKKGIDFRVSLKERYHGMLERDLFVMREKEEALEKVKQLLEIPVSEINTEDYDETFFKQRLAVDKDLAKAYNLLGICMKETNNKSMAVTYFKEALKINPYFSEASENLKNIDGNSSGTKD